LQETCTQIDFDEYSFEGLEKYFVSSSSRKERAELRRQRTDAVLQQQQLQRVLGTIDPDTIGLLSQMLSQRASEEAVARAQRNP
jgi:hypothetical protein